MWQDGQRPCPLVEFLDVGGNPREFLGEHQFDLMLAQLRADHATCSQRHREECVAQDREILEHSIEGETVAYTVEDHPEMGDRELPPDRDPVSVTRGVWEADAGVDRALFDRLLTFLTPAERADHDEDFDQWRRPHPLSVGRVRDVERDTGYKVVKCDGCGAFIGQRDWVATVGDRPRNSALQYPIRYCADCIRSAVAAMDRPKKSRR